MPSEVLSLLIGVTGSIVASIIFLVFLFNLRPKIIFSPYIANQSKNNEPMYAFKIRNKSWFSVMHLKLELTLITPKSVPNGTVYSNELIDLIKTEFFELGPCSKKDKEAHYALRVGTSKDLSNICNTDSQYLMLSITAQHSLSGFSKAFTKHYNPRSDIVKGYHEHGLGMNVK